MIIPSRSSYKNSLLGKHICERYDGIIHFLIMGSGGRKVGDQVHGDVGPRARGDGVRLKEARGSEGGGFRTLAGRAGHHIASNRAGHAGPPISLAHGLEGLEVPVVSSRRHVVVFEEDAGTKNVVLGDGDAVLEKP